MVVEGLNIEGIIKIDNARVYGLEESIIASGYPMQVSTCEMAHKSQVTNKVISEDDYKRARHLGKAVPGSGHDCYLKGIIIQFDMKVPEYIWRQWDRYHFNDYVSSQSKMHRILKLDLDKNCNKYVDTRTINILDDYIKRYNNFEESDKNKDLILRGGIVEYTKENLFNCIIANCPSGLMLTARVTLNYLQAKSVKLQRKTHKMQEWHYICDFFDSLPRFKELTEKNK